MTPNLPKLSLQWPAARKQQPNPCRLPARPGFTLTELMISIALAILLVVGVNAVFRTTGDTLSAGQKVAEANRNEQSLHTVLSEDMTNLVLPEEAPFLLIRSRREAGFVNAADLSGDTDYDAASTDPDTVDARIRSYDRDGDGTDDAMPPAVYTRRNHRVDTLRFFARGLYHRQTGTSTTLVDDMAAREAFITYGHVLQPTPGGPRGLGAAYEGVKRGRTSFPEDPIEPLTASTNPLSFYTSDWVLGRAVTLLAHGLDDNGDGLVDRVPDRSEANQDFYKRWQHPTEFPHMSPLSITSRSNLSSTGGPHIFTSRYDLAAMTMDQYRWLFAHSAQADGNWARSGYFDFRYYYNPLPNRPLDAEGAAYTHTALLPGCSQFIVEFAGDFIGQNADGTIKAAPAGGQPDGVIDFIQVSPTERRIRWYGMPRDLDGIDGNGNLIPAAYPNANALTDVLPLTVVLESAGGGQAPIRPFELFYRSDGSTIATPTDYGASLPADATYVAAWGPHTAGGPKPSMIRILVGTVPATPGGEDRIAEFVFSLK